MPFISGATDFFLGLAYINEGKYHSARIKALGII